MTEEQYMEQRVEDQINWYGKKSAINKKLYVRFNSVIIVCAALIPLFSGISTEIWEYSPYFTGGLGVITASFTGISSMMQFREKWSTYRITSEFLQREKLYYQTHTGPYSKRPHEFGFFVQNIERILLDENSNWVQLVNQSDPSAAGNAG